MKSFTTILTAVMLFAAVCDGFSQGFVNLNFESAKIIPDPDSPYYPYGIATTNALPGWTVYYGANQAYSTTYNDPAAGSASANLITSNYPYEAPLEGSYSVLLQGGAYPYTPDATISQTGLIPNWAVSLLFEARTGTEPGILEVSLDGEALNLSALSAEGNYTLYGADISAFAGTTKTLAFSTLQDVLIYNSWELDSIQFSPSPVPEPGWLALAALGSLLLGFCCRQGQSRQPCSIFSRQILAYTSASGLGMRGSFSSAKSTASKPNFFV